MTKIFKCPRCGRLDYDVSVLPITCGCDYVEYTMSNFIYDDTITAKSALENNRTIVAQATGYGIPKPFPVPKPPEKPTDLPEEVRLWLDQCEEPERS